MDVLPDSHVESKGNGAARPSRRHDQTDVISLTAALTPEQHRQQAAWRRHVRALTAFLETPTATSEARVRGTGDRWIRAYLGEGPDAEQARRFLDDRLFNVRLPVLVQHLHSLGARPVAECFLEIAGNDDGARVTLLAVLERYAKLDPATVRAVGGDVFPPAIFAVANT